MCRCVITTPPNNLAIRSTSIYGGSEDKAATKAELLTPQKPYCSWRSKAKHDGNKSTKKEELHTAIQVLSRKDKVSHWEKRRLLCSGDIPAETQMMGRNQVCWESEVLKPELEVAWHLGRIRITSISKAEGLEQWLGQHINWDRWSGPDIIELCRPQKGIWFFFSATYEKVWGDFRHRSDKTWWTFVKYQSCDYMDVKEQWTQEE